IETAPHSQIYYWVAVSSPARPHAAYHARHTLTQRAAPVPHGSIDLRGTTGVDETDGDSSAVVGQAAAAVIASYAVPDMPAAAFLGTTPATITRPATARDFLLGLASGVDEHGQARQGFALEASPSAIVPGFGVSLDAYRAPGFN